MTASETIADIVAEMRKRKEMLEIAIYSAPICYSTDNQKAQVEIIDEFLDRIEAAAKRERAEVEADALSVGGSVEAMRHQPSNAAAMCEALVTISKVSDDWRLYVNTMPGALDRIYELAQAALAAPPRNCDVGTAEEQEKRFGKFCDSHKRVDGSTVCSPRCPLYKTLECSLQWAQMPYEEGGEK